MSSVTTFDKLTYGIYIIYIQELLPRLESLRLLDDSLSQTATELVIQGVSERQTTDTQQYTELIQHWSQQRRVWTAVYVCVITVIIVKLPS